MDKDEQLARALIAPLTAGRVRGIARAWLRPDAPSKALQELLALADWLDEYHKALGIALAEVETETPTVRPYPTHPPRA